MPAVAGTVPDHPDSTFALGHRLAAFPAGASALTLARAQVDYVGNIALPADPDFYSRLYGASPSRNPRLMEAVATKGIYFGATFGNEHAFFPNPVPFEGDVSLIRNDAVEGRVAG